MKMLMAYLIMNYDVEFMKERPKDMRFLAVSSPKMGETIKVRRRMGV